MNVSSRSSWPISARCGMAMKLSCRDEIGLHLWQNGAELDRAGRAEAIASLRCRNGGDYVYDTVGLVPKRARMMTGRASERWRRCRLRGRAPGGGRPVRVDELSPRTPLRLPLARRSANSALRSMQRPARPMNSVRRSAPPPARSRQGKCDAVTVAAGRKQRCDT